jgi:hypothetical protein
MMPIPKMRLLPAALLLCCVALSAQKRNPLPPQYSSPQELQAQLLSGTDRQRAFLANALSLRNPKSDTVCTSFDEVTSQPLNHPSSSDAVLLTIRATTCDSWFLLPLRRAGTLWKPLKPISIWAKYSTPVIRLTNLISPRNQEILVSNQTVDEGSGILQRNTTIYKAKGDSYSIIFDQPEYLHLSVPYRKQDADLVYEEEQQSRFQFLKDPQDSSTATLIREKRSIQLGNQQLRDEREYHWDAHEQIYRNYGVAPANL